MLARTWAEQGGRSHASGDRPELGPLLAPRALASAVEPLRVGITPTAFDANGAVVAEYATSAAHNHDRVEVTATGPFLLTRPETGDVLFAGESGEVVLLARSAPGGPIALRGPAGALGTVPGPIRVRPAAESALLVVRSVRRLDRLAAPVNGSYPLAPAVYRGELEVFESAADPARVRLVNVVDVEDYVAGVVVNESLGSFHVQALAAQAVAARTYGLAHRGRFAERGFDVDDSTLSQVYRGQTSETPAALTATAETLGLVVTRREGGLVPTLYSSSMGGHTESNEFVFPDGSYPGTNADPALRAVHDGSAPLAFDLSTEEGAREFYTTVPPDSYELHPDTGAPLTSLHRWTRDRSAAELLARLKESFGVPASASRVTDLVTVLRGHSGRAMQVTVRGSWGETVVSGWSNLRRLATLAGVTPGGTGSTSSPNSPSVFAVTRDPGGAVSRVLFQGGGWGHNVGMSQYGTQGRALRGQAAAEILRAYYSDAEVSTAPVALVDAPVAFRFDAGGPASRAVLVVETGTLASVRVLGGGRVLERAARPGERQELDVTALVGGEGAAVLVVLPDGRGGRGVVRVVMEGGR